MKIEIGFRLALLGAVAILLASPCTGAWRDANRNGTMEPYEDPAQPVAVRVDDLISRMTPAEKAGQLNLPYWSPRKDNSSVERLIASGGVGGLLICGGTDPARVNALQRLACEQARLGVPIFNGQDIIHGASVTFPISPFLAGAFEPALFERVSLKPGESREVAFRLTDETLGYRTRDGRFVCDDGRYLVRIAPHAAAGESRFETRSTCRRALMAASASGSAATALSARSCCRCATRRGAATTCESVIAATPVSTDGR